MPENNVIRINGQGAKYDARSLVLQSGAYPETVLSCLELVENTEGVRIDKLAVKPVVVVHEGQNVLLIANKSLEAIQTERQKAGQLTLVCKLANKYVLKKAMIIEQVQPRYREEQNLHHYQTPRRYSHNAESARHYREEYDY